MTDPSGVNLQVIEEFRSTGGTVPSLLWLLPMEKSPSVLLLTSAGAGDGLRRTTPLIYIPDDDRLVVFATADGLPRPDWYDDLMVHPDAVVEVGSQKIDITAVVPSDEETDRLYRRRAAAFPWFAERPATDRAAILLVPHRPEEIERIAHRPWSTRTDRTLPHDARRLGRWSRAVRRLPVPLPSTVG